MAQKLKEKKKVSRKKSSSSRTKSGDRSKRVSAQSVKGRGVSEKTPIYALAIMVLVTVIILLVNQLLNEGNWNKKNRDISSTETVTSDHLSYRNFDEKKDDSPRGDESKYDDSRAVKKTVSEKLVKIYLIRFNEKTERISLAPVMRRVNSDFPLRDALYELIKGPTESERGRGLLSAVPKNLRIRNIETKNRMVVIDFNDAIEKGANGSILLNRIDQIVFTATQFELIDSIKIKINGKGKEFLGSDGLSIGGSLYRRRM
jgi:spore germination protein GerM